MKKSLVLLPFLLMLGCGGQASSATVPDEPTPEQEREMKEHREKVREQETRERRKN